jgi:hypothetical protein
MGGGQHRAQSQDARLRHRRHSPACWNRAICNGKCADLNALYVGLARAAGLPARDVYGVRVADSKFGYKSLGKSGDISKAQHCRAEVWLADFGWLPVDPADVRKVVLEEKPGLTLKDEVVVAARAKAVRRLGDELAGLQRRARPHLARLEGGEDSLLHVSAGRERDGSPRQPRPGELCVQAEFEGDHRRMIVGT